MFSGFSRARRAVLVMGRLATATAAFEGTRQCCARATLSEISPPASDTPEEDGPRGSINIHDPEGNAIKLASWRALIEDARQAFKRSDTAAAEQSLSLALEAAAHFGSSSGPMATSLLNLAQLYRRTGRLESAEPLLSRAAEMLDENAGPHNKVTLIALIDLANTQLERSNTEAAAAGFDDVLERLDEAEETQPQGREALRTVRASVLMQAAKTDVLLGRRERAEERLRNTVELVEERWGADSPRLLGPYMELAKLLHALHRDVEAHELCVRAEKVADKPSQLRKLTELRSQLDAGARPDAVPQS